MNNLMDYLEWRGDLDFDCDGFNEIDNVIMSVLSYVMFDGIVPYVDSQESISLLEVAEMVKNGMNSNAAVGNNPFCKKVPQLLDAAAKTARYANVRLSNYENQIDTELSKQFSAVLFSISPNLHYMAFRGTDNSLVGWQENFQMSFMNEVQAQKQSVIYMNKIMAKTEGRFYIGGHSKGGNLAVYAAIHADQNDYDRIIKVYNNDGPGFLQEIIESEAYQKMLDKISTLIPKSSVIGMLLEHGEEYRVVNSSETGIMQHDALSWEVRGKNFIYEAALTKSSIDINSTIIAWLNQLSMEEREKFVGTAFNIIQATGATTVSELTNEKLGKVDAIIKTYKDLDELTQVNLKKTIELLFGEGQKTLKSSINNEVKVLLSKVKPKNLPLPKKTEYILQEKNNRTE